MKKGILILILLILALFSVSGIYASDVDDALAASEDTNQIELFDSDKVIEDNLQTSEENEALASTDYDEALSAQTDTEVLGADSATYFDLAEEIGHSGNINLIHKNYTYDGGEPITISEDNKVIDGNGAVIDMNGSTIRAFHVSASGVTIKNLTIKNANYNGDGGAIYFSNSGTSGTVSNCNFTDNKAYFGAVYFNGNGNVTNCNFTDNTASGDGGAVYFSNTGSVSNCNFADNKATGTNSWGGAIYIYSGTVTNCNFAGNNATGDGGAVYFYQGTGSVTNCNFTNNKATGTGKYDGGGAVYLQGTGSLTNCNFVDNTASRDGGAIRFSGSGNVSNCNFTDNSAREGGAVYFSSNGKGNVSNCNFTDNSATDGGAISIDFGTVSNCNFADNTAVYGGAINIDFGTVSNCNFVNNSATGEGSWGGAIRMYSGTVSNCNFTDNTADYAGAVYFNGNGEVTNCNFTDNTASGDGGAVWIVSGTVSNCNFADNTADYAGAVFFLNTGNVTNCNFTNNTATVDGGAVYFNGTGEVTNCNFTNNTATSQGGAVYFWDPGTVSNCNFTDNTAYGDGGAVFFFGQGNVTNCNFTGNTATVDGGAVYFWDQGTVTNCNFTDNTASIDGGAVYFLSGTGTVTNCDFTGNTATRDGGAINMGSGTVSNCNFTGNNATTGSAIYFYSILATKTVSNSRFLNNRANAEALEITKNDNNITITFTGRNNLLNAIYSSNDVEVTFTNVTYWSANGISNTGISPTTPARSKYESGQKITVGVVVNNELVLNEVNVTDENGMIVLDISAGENYYISARHDADSYYTEAERTISNNTKFNVNVTSQTTTNKTVNITAKSNIYSEVMPGKLLFILPNGTQINATYGANGIWWAEHTFDAYGEYKVNATYVGLDNVTVNNATITVNKIKTELSGNAITTTYNINKDLIITLKDSNGNPVSGAKLIVDLNGAKTYTTDKNGQIKVSTKGLAPKAYTAKVTFNGNTNYDKSTKDVKVTVKKATPKLTAKKKTFKTTPKTKKYSIVLKDNTGKAIKKAKVTLKVKGKTYKATTNSKGKATFKITKLTKKGTYKATITFKGDKFYKKVSKKTKIKVIVTFKTVSKGSKDKATVKEIQQALKDKGYYLTYQGHYLKVDGKFSSCTFRSVKEFQHDNGLKVTGKVDEKTAQKLKII